MLNNIKESLWNQFGASIDTLENTINALWVNPYKNFSIPEILLYNVRHVQRHTAQLSLLLRQAIHDATDWVSRAEIR